MLRIVQIETHELFERSLKELSDRHPALREALIDDFRNYVASESRELPSTFGRDSIFNEPYLAQRAGLRHIHICLRPGGFKTHLGQHDRTNRLGDPDNDVFLVYVQHEFHEDRYLILVLMHPDAHEKARDSIIMKHLGYIAQEFQDS